MEKAENLSRRQKFVTGLKKTGYVLSCFVWIPLSIAVNLATLPIALVPRWVGDTIREGLSGFLLAPLVYGLFYPLAVPFIVATDYGNEIESGCQRHSFFETFFAATQFMLDVNNSSGLQGHTAGQKFVCGLKRTLFALSCALWIPLGIALDVVLMPFTIITNCALWTKREGVKGFFGSVLSAVTYPFYPVYNAVRGAVFHGRKIGTDRSTARSFAEFVFSPAIELANNVKELFALAKTASKPSVSSQPTGGNNLGQEQGDQDKQTGDRITKAKNKNKEQRQPGQEGQNLGEKKL